MSAKVVIHDAAKHRWLRLDDPVDVVCTGRLDEVQSCLRKVERAVAADRLYAAGFLSYEAAPAFDAALTVRQVDCTFPLLWFGLFPAAETLPELPPVTGSPPALGPWTASVSRRDYHQAIARIKEHLGNGDTYQVNYTLRLRSPFDGDPRRLFTTLANNQQSAYAAYVDTGRFVLCSASPELFFRLERGTITSKPMKGTARRGLTLAEDREQAEWLRQSEKNRAENVMIVDMIRNDIGRLAQPGTVHVPRLFEVERYPTVWQMTSTVEAQTEATLAETFAALFPCASITGAPKPSTMRIIAELESTPRRIYTGTIGFIEPSGAAQFNVAIRTVLVDRDTGGAEYGTGGGIVWDSEPEDEYLESQLKARILSDERPRFQLLETMLWTPEDGVFLLDLHLKRLQRSAEYFGMRLKMHSVQAMVTHRTRNLPPAPHKARLLVSADGTTSLEVSALDPNAATGPVRLRLAEEPIDANDPFLYHKTTHRTVYDRAKASRPDCDDVLLWNKDGEVTEACIANLVAKLDGELVTPPVRCGLLAGTFRAWLIEQDEVRERVIRVDELPRCSRLFVTNSVRKWREAELLNPAGSPA